MIRESFFPFKARKILVIALSNATQHDEFCWLGTRDGTYKVKFAYYLIRSYERNTLESSTN